MPEAVPAGPGIPNFYCGIPAAADNPPAVGAETDASDPSGVSFECEHFLAGLGIPDFEGLVPAAADEPRAVGAETDTIDDM